MQEYLPTKQIQNWGCKIYKDNTRYWNSSSYIVLVCLLEFAGFPCCSSHLVVGLFPSRPCRLQALAQCTKVEGFSSLAARSSLRLYPDGLGGWVEWIRPGTWWSETLDDSTMLQLIICKTPDTIMPSSFALDNLSLTSQMADWCFHTTAGNGRTFTGRFCGLANGYRTRAHPASTGWLGAAFGHLTSQNGEATNSCQLMRSGV